MFVLKLYECISKILIKLFKIFNYLGLMVCREIGDYKNLHIKKWLMPYLFKSLRLTKLNSIANDRCFNKVIWFFWWQNKMPILIKKCFLSIKNHSGDFSVILINNKNVKKYTDLPKYIYDKLNNKDITLTHFSDILRYNLLKNNGGLWIDSTNFCTSNLNSKSFNKMNLFTTIGNNNKYHYWVSDKWTGSIIGGHKGNSLFVFMCNFFNQYWRYNNKLINYNLVDYALWYAYIKNIGGFKSSVDSIYSYNNLNKYKLEPLLNKRYNKSKFKRLTSNTQLFKLTYKHKHDKSFGTYYYYLLHNKL